jgi:hypothetical protein
MADAALTERRRHYRRRAMPTEDVSPQSSVGCMVTE